MSIQGKVFKKIGSFKYLESVLDEDGILMGDMNNRIQAWWKNWRTVTGAMCDRNISMKLKRKLFKTVVKLVMLHGAETWHMKGINENMEVAEKIKGPVMEAQNDKVKHAMGMMKNGKVAKPSGVVVELVKALGDEEVQWATELLRKVWDEKIPEDRRKSFIAPIFQKKSHIVSCGNLL